MMSSRVAYCYTRVSTKSQEVSGHSLDFQKTTLEDLAKKNGHTLTTVEEVCSGRNLNEQKVLLSILNKLQNENVEALYVTRVDRLCRSTLDLLIIAQILADNSVLLITPSQTFDMDNLQDKLSFSLSASYAEYEAKLLSVRTKEGLIAAKANGRVGGRRSKLTKKEKFDVKEMYESKIYTVREIANMYNVSPPTLYRAMEELNEQ